MTGFIRDLCVQLRYGRDEPRRTRARRAETDEPSDDRDEPRRAERWPSRAEPSETAERRGTAPAAARATRLAIDARCRLASRAPKALPPCAVAGEDPGLALQRPQSAPQRAARRRCRTGGAAHRRASLQTEPQGCEGCARRVARRVASTAERRAARPEGGAQRVTRYSSKLFHQSECKTPYHESMIIPVPKAGST